MAADGNQLIGTIMLFAGNFAPRSWAYCDGQIMSINANSALYSILGTTYGGDGRSTFALPDLRGRVPLGPRTGPGLSTYQLGQKGGEETHTLKVNEMPSHFHIAVNDPSTDQHVLLSTDEAVNETPSLGDVRASGSYGTGLGQSLKSFGPPTNVVQGQAISGNAGLTLGNTGGNQEHLNIQPYQSVNYIIALTGLYPSRN